MEDATTRKKKKKKKHQNRESDIEALTHRSSDIQEALPVSSIPAANPLMEAKGKCTIGPGEEVASGSFWLQALCIQKPEWHLVPQLCLPIPSWPQTLSLREDLWEDASSSRPGFTSLTHCDSVFRPVSDKDHKRSHVHLNLRYQRVGEGIATVNLGKSTCGEPPTETTTWPGTTVTTCMSYLKQEVLVRNTVLTSYHHLKEFQERSKGERNCQFICPANLPESLLLESILAEQCTVPRKDPSQ